MLFIAGLAGGYFLLGRSGLIRSPISPELTALNLQHDETNYISLKLFYPQLGGLKTVERKLPDRSEQIAVAETVIEEFFKGEPDSNRLPMPHNVRLLGVYKDASRMLYIDLSDELRRNFQGDALSEYLLLKAFYESLAANLHELEDVKILVEGKELESLGGHVYLKYPLKNIVSADYKTETRSAHE